MNYPIETIYRIEGDGSPIEVTIVEETCGPCLRIVEQGNGDITLSLNELKAISMIAATKVEQPEVAA